MVDNGEWVEYSFAEASGTGSSREDGVVIIGEQDRLLPIANVGRIMKQILPSNAKLSKEAKETMQECVSEFISFVTGEASDKCRNEKRKTVNGDDVCWALANLGFDDYAEPLKRYLNRYRDMEGDRDRPNQNYKADEEKDEPLGNPTANAPTSFQFYVAEEIDYNSFPGRF